jgi:hypothetical protein
MFAVTGLCGGPCFRDGERVAGDVAKLVELILQTW